MKKEILKFIEEEGLVPFREKLTKSRGSCLFKTSDAKTINQKIINKISSFFEFENSSKILNYLSFTDDVEEIKKRQNFFSKIQGYNKEFLKKMSTPRVSWKPKYDVTVITENEETFMELKKNGCPVQYITGENDLSILENCEIIQVIDCDSFSQMLERLPQTVFLKSIDEAYLERYVEEASSWENNIKVLEKENFDEEVSKIVEEIKPVMEIISQKDKKKVTKQEIDDALEEINEEVSQKIKGMTLSGDLFFEIVSKNKIPKEIENIIKESIDKKGFPNYLFNISLPVSLDDSEMQAFLKKQDSEEFTSSAELIKKNSSLLISLPEKIKRLENLLVYFDFISGIYDFCIQNNCINQIEISNELKLENTRNILINNATPISFYLDNTYKCSILTGANSGGKTTLLEHIIQLISLFNLGLPCSGNVKIPLFSEVYYFAKNKGSANKGAFETLLTQLSQIKAGVKTLILADEIESVTEPGVAGNIISASCNYFIKKGCFLVIATHLGQEIQKTIPEFTRIDGIEAKGLNEEFELIVDHNPVLGRLANSTPELIVEKMANIQKMDYFIYLNNYLRENRDSNKKIYKEERAF